MRAVAVAFAVAFVAIGGCSPLSAPTESPIPFPILQAAVGTPDGVVGVAHTEPLLELYLIDGESPHKLTSARESGNRPTVHLLAFGGETNSVYNSFVFGMAPEGATRFSLAPIGSGIGGEIVEDTFVLALMKRDVSPDELNWAFLAADGSVVAEGSGIRD